MMNHKKFMGHCSVALLSVLALTQLPQFVAAEEAPTDVTTVTAAEEKQDVPVEEATTVENNTEEHAETPASEPDVVILHTNDIHGRLLEDKRGKVIGVAKLDAIADAEKAKTDQITLLLDAGDAFQGLPISNSTKGEDMAEALNAIGYDAMAVGNHEFDFSLEQAAKYKEKLNFPLLSANTYVNGARLFEASAIIDKDKTRVGDEFVVIGVTTPETYTKTHPNNVKGVEFKEPIKEVENVIAEIEAKAKAENKTYNKYIILAHLGIDSTTPVEWQGGTLAEALSKNPLLANKKVIILDGHSHTVHTATYGDNVLYNQAGSYLQHIGKVTLKADGKLSGTTLSAKDVENVTPSEDIAKIVAAAKEKFDKENSVVIVKNNTVELNGERENVRVRETNLGNVVADSLYLYGQTGFSHKTDIAVTNGGGLRATIKKDADITRGDVISVLPFGNIASQIEVKGSQILEMFHKSLSAPLQNKDGQPVLDANKLPLLEANGAFLHISGARIFFDPTLEPAQRILKVEVFNREKQQFELLDLEKTYYLATNDFLAAGGDGYTMLGGAREEGPSLDGIFADYLKNTPNLSRYTEVNSQKRIIALAKDADNDEDGVANAEELSKGRNPFIKEKENTMSDDTTQPDTKPSNETPKENKPSTETTKDDTPTTTTTPTPNKEVPTKTNTSKPEETKPVKESAPVVSTPQPVATPSATTLPETSEASTLFLTLSGLTSLLSGAFITKRRK